MIHKPILENQNINFHNLYLFIKNVIVKYYKISSVVIFIYFFYFVLKSPVYTSSVSFYSNYSSQPNVSSLGFLQSITGDLGNADLGFSIGDYLNSNRFSDEVINRKYVIDNTKISLVDHLEIQGSSIISLNPIATIQNLRKSINLSDHLTQKDKVALRAQEYITDNISYSEDRKTQLHSISFSSKDSELSEQIINSIFMSIVQYSNEVNNTKANEKKLFIQQRLIDISSKLEKAENEMLIFLEQNKSILSPSLLLQEKRMEKSITLYNQLYISLSDQLELAKIDEKDNTSPIVLLDEPSIIAYKSGSSLLENIFLLTFILLAFFCSAECYRNSKDLFDL